MPGASPKKWHDPWAPARIADRQTEQRTSWAAELRPHRKVTRVGDSIVALIHFHGARLVWSHRKADSHVGRLPSLGIGGTPPSWPELISSAANR